MKKILIIAAIGVFILYNLPEPVHPVIKYKKGMAAGIIGGISAPVAGAASYMLYKKIKNQKMYDKGINVPSNLEFTE